MTPPDNNNDAEDREAVDYNKFMREMASAAIDRVAKIYEQAKNEVADREAVARALPDPPLFKIEAWKLQAADAVLRDLAARGRLVKPTPPTSETFLEMIRTLEARAAALEKERDEFYAEYRKACDIETKALHVKLAAAECEAKRRGDALILVREGARSQGAFTGMSWLQVERIIDAALAPQAPTGAGE